MDNITIKYHPPWYARGTPVINTRDGPAMAFSDKPLFAIREGPSARGKPMGKTRPWLTLKTTFFNTQNSVYGQWYAILRSRNTGLIDEYVGVDGSEGFKDAKSKDVDLSACMNAIMHECMNEGHSRGHPPEAKGKLPAARGKPPENGAIQRKLNMLLFTGQNLPEMGEVCATDLSAFAEHDNVGYEMDNNVESKFNAVKSKDVDRLEEDVDLSACEAPDNVKLEMDDNVKLEMDDNVKLEMDDNVKLEMDDNVKLEMDDNVGYGMEDNKLKFKRNGTHKFRRR